MRTGPRIISLYSGPFARRPRLRSAAGAAIALVLLAAASSPASAATRNFSGSEVQPATCVVHSLPAFTAQGEFGTAATVADIIEVECNPFVYGTGSRIKVTAAQLFSRCKGHVRWYTLGEENTASRLNPVGTPGVSLTLDADGNATVAVLAGPECAAGESLVSAHMEEEPFESFTTSFTVLPPENTPAGVFALPAAEVEDSHTSSVATILEAEFPGGSEKLARFASEELFSRCRAAPHMRWIRMDGSSAEGVSEVTGIQLDNNGNAFVIALGTSSCAEGTSLIEADLESKPFTTYTTAFTVLPPQPTAEPAFTIEKQQQIMGSGFTTAPLSGTVGAKVEYKIVVRNTATVPETLSNFVDAHCDPGTIAGGPGASPLAPGAPTTYTCSHVLTEPGTYTNDATVTAETVGGTPLTQTSNEVVVNVPHERSLTLEKLQLIAGSGSPFTRATLTGAIGQTVDYEIVVTNTGNTPLLLTGFTDAHCDGGTIAGGPGSVPLAPGASTTYTCDHVLTSTGAYVNQASVTGESPGEPPLNATSNTVEVDVPEKVSPIPPHGALPFCASEPGQIRGGSGFKRGAFTVRIASSGIKQVVFYLDGRRVKTLGSAQAKGGTYTIRIDARKLGYGTHRLRAALVMSNSVCPPAARSSVFVRPKARPLPSFPG